MTNIRAALPFLLFCLVLSACGDGQDDGVHFPHLDAIPATQYYSADPLAPKHAGVYGAWKVVGTSGGFHGGGYPPDFDYLLVKPNAIFGIVRHDSLLTSGKIVVQNDPAFDLLVHLISEDSNSINIQIIQDYEKFVVFQSDTMYLYSTCCDRYDTVLKRVE